MYSGGIKGVDMARLPMPGQDSGKWGDILNDFLTTIHNADGSLKENSVTATALAPGAVVADNFVAGAGQDGHVLVKDSASASGLAWRSVNATGGAVTSVAGKTGVVTLTKTDVGLANVDNTADASKPVSTDMQTALDTKADKTAVYTKTEADSTFALKGSGSGGATTLDGLSDVTATGATNGQALVYNGTEWSPATVGTGTATIPDATDIVKGVVALAGDLGGNASMPLVSKLNGVAISGTPAAGNVLTASGATAATWAAPTGGGGGTAGGGYAFSIKLVTAATVTAVSNDCIMADPTVNAITVTLPSPVANGIVRVKRTIAGGGNGVQIAAPSGAVIDAQTVGSDVLNYDFQSQDYWSDGTKWYRV